MKENLVTIVVSVLAGLLVGFLVWGATSAWGARPTEPAMINGSGNGMMGGVPVSGSGMMGPGMMGGMMQGMGPMNGMMGQGMMNPGQMPNMQGMMYEHMAQGQAMMQNMMGMMQHMQASPPYDRK